MEAIGGYFELELRKGEHYHKDAIRLNSGSNCFEYILRARKYEKVYVPYYTCHVIFDVAQRLGVEIAYYHMNEQLEPTELLNLEAQEAFLYTNYYGLKQSCVERLTEKFGKQLIVDNAQAFYAKPIEGIDTFYSPRKFFGVPDGGYLYTDAVFNEDFPQAESMQRMTHLLKRIEQGAEAGYADYQREEETLDGSPIERMSKLTDVLLGNIDYKEIAERRIANYQLLDEQLRSTNLIHLSLEDGAVPMVYPYLFGDPTMRKRMIEKKVFVATYWPNVSSDCTIETMLKSNLLPLPIDQRYNVDDMQQIIEVSQNEANVRTKDNLQDLRGGGVKIRPLKIEDAKTSYKWRNDNEVFKYTGNTYDNYILYETELEWIKRVIKNTDEYRCAIEIDGTYVGNIYLTDIKEGSAEYQIFIGEKAYWGKGVAAEASRQILEYAFGELKLHSVFLNVRKQNTRAIGLYEKLGFTREMQEGDWIAMRINPTQYQVNNEDGNKSRDKNVKQSGGGTCYPHG